LALADPKRIAAARELYQALGVAKRAAELTPASAEHEMAPTSSDPSVAPGNLFLREGEFWTLRYQGNRPGCGTPRVCVRPGGAAQRARRGVPAVELAAARSAASVARVPAGELHEPGDLGEVVDAQARAAYRGRLLELDEQEADADARGDQQRSIALASERDALVAQLSAAYGLGGRARRAGHPPNGHGPRSPRASAMRCGGLTPHTPHSARIFAIGEHRDVLWLPPGTTHHVGAPTVKFARVKKRR